MNFSNKVIKYFLGLKTPQDLPSGISIVNPYESKGVRVAVKEFYSKYFDDGNERLFAFGINPGRFGAGLTGISFTDPVALKESCGVDNNLGHKKELSSKFIYSTIDAFGGTKKFYSKIFLTAVYPLALISDGKNFNYYDTRELKEALYGTIKKEIQKQILLGARQDKAVILGKKNAEYFKLINDDIKYFEKIIVLEHPRYIMQYNLKKMNFYIKKYLDALKD